MQVLFNGIDPFGICERLAGVRGFISVHCEKVLDKKTSLRQQQGALLLLPTGQQDVVAKTRLAAEELYKLTKAGQLSG